MKLLNIAWNDVKLCMKNIKNFTQFYKICIWLPFQNVVTNVSLMYSQYITITHNLLSYGPLSLSFCVGKYSTFQTKSESRTKKKHIYNNVKRGKILFGRLSLHIQFSLSKPFSYSCLLIFVLRNTWKVTIK